MRVLTTTAWSMMSLWTAPVFPAWVVIGVVAVRLASLVRVSAAVSNECLQGAA